MSSQEYNGWTNYETWLMALNIDNDQGMQECVLELIYNNSGPYIMTSSDLKDWIEDMIAIECHGTQMYKIFDSWSECEFANIDWYNRLTPDAEECLRGMIGDDE